MALSLGWAILVAFQVWLPPMPFSRQAMYLNPMKNTSTEAFPKCCSIDSHELRDARTVWTVLR